MSNCASLSEWSLENIPLVTFIKKLKGIGTTKYEQIAKLEHLFCPKRSCTKTLVSLQKCVLEGRHVPLSSSPSTTSFITSWVADDTPNDHPKSVRNRCVLEDFGGVCSVILLFGFFCRCTEGVL